jgi:CheY-specific phosphatase CheX
MQSPEALRELLGRASVEAFGDLGFLLADEVGDPAAADTDPGTEPEPPVATAQIRVRGVRVGVVMVQVTAGVLAMVATNMLALDDAPDAGVQRDALGEIANVIVGRFISDLGDAGFDATMGTPEISDGGAIAVADPICAHLRLTFLEGTADVALVWDEEAA